MMTNSDKVIATAGQAQSDNNGPYTKHQVKSVEDYKKDNLAHPQKHLPDAHQILINISGESEGRDGGLTTRQRKDEVSLQNSQGSSAVQSYRVADTINTPQLL